MPQLLLAVLLTGLLTFVLMRLNFYRLVWHRPLVELALFCMILGLIVALTPDGWPIWPTRTSAETVR